ncbi:MAG: hypothetical protein IT462_17445 [Planctomycetes bacterium]|nr:hypothetical protein [Planctomycetota bacterium]
MKYVLGLVVVFALLVAAAFTFAPSQTFAAGEAPVTGDLGAATALAEKRHSRLLVAVDERPS